MSVALPTFAVEVAFATGANAAAWALGSTAFPATLGEATVWVWTDVTADVRAITVTRGKSRELDQYQAGRCAVTLDNRSRDYDPLNLSGPYVSGGATQVKPGRRLRVRATHQSVTYDLFMGVIRDWSIEYTGPFDSRAIPQATDFITDLARTGVNVTTTAGLTGQAIKSVLDDAGVSAYTLDDGVETLQAMTFTADALAAIHTLERSDQGHFYVENDGTATFIERTGPIVLTRSNTSQGTFGAGNLSYQGPEDRMRYEADVLINDARFTRQGGTEQTYTDETSVSDYGKRTQTYGGLANATDAAALYLATGYVGKWAEPLLRVRQVTFHAQYHADTMTQALARRILDRITVNFTPPGGGSPISQAAHIIGITHQITPQQGMVTAFVLTNVGGLGWILGVGELGDAAGTTATVLAF